MNQPAPRDDKPRGINLGFASVREFMSYLMGGFTLYYGIVEAAPDRQLIVVGAGLTLLGLPVVGTIFGKKE